MRPLHFTSLTCAALLVAACSSHPPAMWGAGDPASLQALPPD